MVLWIVATFTAFFIKGLCGFANTLIFTSIMGFGAANVSISPVELLLGYPANIILTFKNRKKFKISVFAPLALLVIVGSIPGALLLKSIDVRYLKIICGFVIVLIGAEMFYREFRTSKVRESKIVLTIIGLLSGMLCGLFGIGALLAAYVGRVTESSDEFKANISAVFIVDNTFRVILYSLLGVITRETLISAAVLMPVVLLGLFLGMKSAQILNDRIVKKCVIVLLIISGIALIVNNMI
ncbi:sulfite exporter TauE/SafE family protein [Butyrivibrio fibrisolvens]|uniref:sulfite exporter TauE/SafE family protein n=1 Tax=Butyrivibrio fibrisolvens TaxID=831 RepID=UPI0020BD7229|nr:sulfite exporter TauE/SafE family protein [Butyrivibrio fibrisolvens]